eukprot:6419375-Prymnesium_polylepis.1
MSDWTESELAQDLARLFSRTAKRTSDLDALLAQMEEAARKGEGLSRKDFVSLMRDSGSTLLLSAREAVQAKWVQHIKSRKKARPEA